MKTLVSTLNLSNEQWLEHRRAGLGGSDAAVVMGVSRWKSPYELWQEKLGEVPEQEAGEPALWGSLLEPVVRNEFSRRTGIEVLSVNHILQSTQYPFMFASLDGVANHPEYGKCVVEIKTCNAFKSHAWDNGAVPPEYLLQVQHYLCVTNYNGAFVAVLIGGNEFRWTFVPREEAVIRMLVQREADFWQRVVDGVPPDVDGTEACANFLKQKYLTCEPKSKIQLPDSASDLIDQHRAASVQLEQATTQKREAENKLKQMLGNNEVGIVGDSHIRWQSISKDGFDSKLLKAEQPSLYDKYTSKTSYRRFSITTKAAS